MALTKTTDITGIRFVKTDLGDRLFVDSHIRITDGDTTISETITSKFFVRGDDVSAEDSLVKEIYNVVFK